MMGCPSRTYRAEIARRAVALAALLSFSLGNVGWPSSPQIPRDQDGPRGCCGKPVALAGPGACCCGAHAGKSSCECRQRLAAAKTGSCCQKKHAAERNSPLPALTCHCGDSPVPGYIVSSQPKLQAPSVAMPQLLEVSWTDSVPSPARPQGALPPEIPPPRPSAA
jgi:hypothetical protein